ncbi:hypothetical protein [Paractinoplanes hotanensis]|uniref:Uncharacterized protein n=1 Tax=Paractinoplanes hotanensis TaxID=2906497 RepID=A0ABT0YFV4_9ACTN|nr:hypothetical protein [Actinoplanes hotanensis]MCM4084951.1 hypothetical protein [Actinoplanes hotanensis]
MDTSLLVGLVAGGSAIAGVVVTSVANIANERRKIEHDRKVKDTDRQRAIADRRRAFEIENLQAAYDGLWQMMRDSTKTHLEDLKIARTTEHGYGGTLLGFDTDEKELAVRAQIRKSIRLILDEDIRRKADDATSAMTDVVMLGVKGKALNQGPVSAAHGEDMHNKAIMLADDAMDAISERLRQLFSED